MLGDRLSALDIPSDGSAKLVSVNTSFDESGLRQWTVVFRETKASTTGACAPPPPMLNEQPHQAPFVKPSQAKVVSPTKSVNFNTFPPPITKPAGLVPGRLVPSAAEPQKVMMDRIFPLKCQVKTYAWGKLGEESLVGLLANEGLEQLEITSNVPYAELWMGTHPSGPSMVMLSSPWRTVTPLSEWIRLNPSLLGPPRPGPLGQTRIERRKSMLRLTESSLPFLFKVLSVRTALSIQAHPDKALAARLHARQPDMYKDDNHKPEMAVAITPFEALCSFQPAYSILENCRATPELVALVGEASVAALEDAANRRAAADREAERPLSPKGTAASFGGLSSPRESLSLGQPSPKQVDCADEFKAALREVFRRLVSAPVARVTEQLDALMSRVQSTNEMLRAPVDVLAMRLHEQYPGDVGVFCAYLLNYKQLQPGEALFMGANEPHAYIAGDCVEVMATSDNVVRAGLTPKWKDVDTLVDMLTYSDGSPHLVTPTQPHNEPHVWRYAPPDVVDEFMLDRVELPAGGAANLSSAAGLAVVLVIRGDAAVEQLDSATDDSVGLRHELAAGAVHLVCPHTVLRISAVDGPVLLFRAAAKPVDENVIDIDTGLTTG